MYVTLLISELLLLCFFLVYVPSELGSVKEKIVMVEVDGYWMEQSQARAVEALVRTKMHHKEFIILCLEDSSDWSNATTRSIVMQVCFL